MNDNRTQYNQPEVAILGSASDLIQSDKDGAGEPGLEARLGFDD